MAKATHQGHCQVCGSKQMLPSGKLAKHGYTVRFSFFEGICAGAEHLPFEQDKSLIDAAIAGAEQKAAALRTEAERRDTSLDPNDVKFSVYRSEWASRTVRGYRTMAGKIEQRSQYLFAFVYEYNGKTCEHEIRESSLDKVVKQCNEQEAWRLRQIVKQCEDYVAWQRARIANWKPQPLIPRKD